MKHSEASCPWKWVAERIAAFSCELSLASPISLTRIQRFSVFPFCVQAILFGAWLHDADANAEECLSRCVTWVFWLPKMLLVVELRDKVGCRWRWSNVIRWLGITFVLQFPTLQLLTLCRMHWPWCMKSWQARCKWAHASARCPFVPKWLL